jgi:hypothetical protein
VATPANSFRKVSEAVPEAITVTLRAAPGGAVGEVAGPAPVPPDASAPLSMGQDGSLSALQALAVACHLANQLGTEVVIRDDAGRWRPDWGRLEEA